MAKKKIILPKVENNQQVGEDTYLYDDEHDFLGQGSYGAVFKVERKEKDGKSSFFALKIMHIDTSIGRSINPKELEIFSQYYKAYNSLHLKGQTEDTLYFVSELFPGKPIMSKGAVNPQLVLLTFTQRLKLVNQLTTQILLLHNNTLSTGLATIHGDIKPQNINIYIDRAKGIFDAYLLDFGLSINLNDENGDLVQHPNGITGDGTYFPIETLQQKFGMKTDIYMLTVVLALILGETRPYFKKTAMKVASLVSPYTDAEIQNYLKDNERLAMEPFNVDLIMMFPKLLPGIDLRQLVIKFLNRMQDNVYDKRPNANEVFIFFNNLLLLTLGIEKGINPSDLSATLAPILLIANDLFEKKLGSHHSAETFSSFSFVHNPQITDLIIDRFKANKLDESVVKYSHELICEQKNKENELAHEQTTQLYAQLCEYADTMNLCALVSSIGGYHQDSLKSKTDDEVIIANHVFNPQINQLLKLIINTLSYCDHLSSAAQADRDFIYRRCETLLEQLAAKQRHSQYPEFNLDVENLTLEIDLHNLVAVIKEKNVILLNNLMLRFIHTGHKDFLEKECMTNSSKDLTNVVAELVIKMYLHLLQTSTSIKTLFSPVDENKSWLEKQIQILMPDIELVKFPAQSTPGTADKILYYIAEHLPELLPETKGVKPRLP